MLSKVAMKEIVIHVANALEPHGFKAKGSSFYRDSKDLISIINIQKSDKSSEFRLVITVNLGIYIKSIADNPNMPPDIWSCQWQERIGFLLPEKRDVWWEINSFADASNVAETLKRAIIDHGLPEIESKASVAKMLEYWRSGESAGLTEGQRVRYVQLLESKSETGQR